MHPEEAWLATMNDKRPDLLSPANRDLAEAQHKCRERNNSSAACAAIQTLACGTRAACGQCAVTRHREAAGTPPIDHHYYTREGNS